MRPESSISPMTSAYMSNHADEPPPAMQQRVECCRQSRSALAKPSSDVRTTDGWVNEMS
jgi:hypothetical protein